MQENNLEMPQNSLTTVIDAAGNLYQVPICCLQLPEFYEKECLVRPQRRPTEDFVEIKIKSTEFGYLFAELEMSVSRKR